MSRFRLSAFVLTIFFVIIIVRLFVIQIINPNNILPLEKYVQVDKVDSLRGEIFDIKNAPLVLNRKVYTVYADIEKLKKNKKLQAILEKELRIEETTMSALLQLNKWRKIKTKVSADSKDALSRFYPAYLNFEEEWLRFYPEGSMSAQLLGFVGYDEAGRQKGYLGLEGYYNQELSGLPVVRERESDFLGIPFIGGIFKESKQNAGLDIYSTIDANVQRMMEEELWKGLTRYEARQACAIIMNPYTGALSGFGCVPSYNPAQYFEYETVDFLNPLTAQVYEPGSTFKPLIVAMALDQKKITPTTILDEEGPLQVGEYSIKTWNEEYRERISVTQTLQYSSNVGMVNIIQRLKKKIVENYMEKLGLWEKTGVEIEGEANSLIKSAQDWYDIDFATISFGQGLAVTPIQLVRAFATLANDGILVQPTLVKKLVDPNNKRIVPHSSPDFPRVFSPKTTQQMKKMLFATVDKAEAYWPTKTKGYSFCGKTGTAQVAIKGHYDPDKTIASFIGFLPCEKPEFLMLVLYYEPQSSPWGSETAAPTFFNIANSLIMYYNISPTVNTY